MARPRPPQIQLAIAFGGIFEQFFYRPPNYSVKAPALPILEIPLAYSYTV